jgi:hypothetical protein
MSNRIGGVVPVEQREYVQQLIDRRNKFARQRDGLQGRVDKLDAKIAAVDREIAAAAV